MKQRVSACSSCVFVIRCEFLSSLTGRFANMADVPTCQICQQVLDDGADGADLRVHMRCTHAFHYECIMEWAKAKGVDCTTMAELWETNVKCPICKKSGIEIGNAEVFVFSGKTARVRSGRPRLVATNVSQKFTNYDDELLRHRFLGVVCFSLLILSLSQISKP